MSYPGTQDREGPWLQGLTSSGSALQGSWASSLVTYSATNSVATLSLGLKADWAINANMEDSISAGQLASYRPDTSGDTNKYALWNDWNAGAGQRGPEDLNLTGANAAGIYLFNAYAGAPPTFGGFSRWTTLAEIVV
jgi:hypothetical protein